MKKTWFISDLHLDPSRPHLFSLLHAFLDDIENQADALYILGDLFEFWMGDDIIDSPLGADFLPVIKHLKKISSSGIELFFTQGNRDFFVRNRLLESMGAKLLPDTQVIDLYGIPTLVLHGDILCTNDKGYQLMRKLFRIKFLQFIYLSLRLESRAKRVRKVRKVTHRQTQNKDYTILDVNQQAVEELMRKNNVLQMIHGHTHRPATHVFTLDGKEAKRWVLGDWKEGKPSFIKASTDGITLLDSRIADRVKT